MKKQVLPILATPTLRAAIEAGKVDGDIYADGEVWVDFPSFEAWLTDDKNHEKVA